MSSDLEKKLKKRKNLGIDNLNVELLKHGSVLLKQVATIIQQCYSITFKYPKTRKQEL
jgi:hypothetical protein